jgi:DNA-binding MarR family transcriptional regulator
MSKSIESLPSADLCNATAIRRASRRITQLYDGMLEPTGLRSTQLAILSEVAQAGSEPIAMGELAESLTLDRSALGHNLRPLLREGYLELRKCADDRRQSHVGLTASGRAKYREARSLWRKAQRAFDARVGATSAKRLRKMMVDVANLDVLDS